MPLLGRPITAMLTTPECAFLLNLLNMSRLSWVQYWSLNSLYMQTKF